MVGFLEENYLVSRCMHGWFSGRELSSLQCMHGWFSGRELSSLQIYTWLVSWKRMI